MKTKSICSLLVALMLPLLVSAQEGSNLRRRESYKSDNPYNSRAKVSKKDSARAMKKGDMNNKGGTTQEPRSKKMAKNRADN